MTPPVSKEVQLSALEYIKRQSPFVIVMILMLAVIAWDDHHDRKADIQIMRELREIDATRLEAITSALARMSESCPERLR